jgi:hypothetical protein
MASCSISAELRLPNHNSSGRTALHRKRRSLFLSPDQIAGIHVPEANNGHGYGRAQFIPACAGTVLSQRCSGAGLCSPSRSYKKDPFLHSTPLVGPLLQRPPSVYNRAKNGPRPRYHDLAALTSYCSSFHTTVDSSANFAISPRSVCPVATTPLCDWSPPVRACCRRRISLDRARLRNPPPPDVNRTSMRRRQFAEPPRRHAEVLASRKPHLHQDRHRHRNRHVGSTIMLIGEHNIRRRQER